MQEEIVTILIAVMLLMGLSGCFGFDPHGCGDQCGSWQVCNNGSCDTKDGYCDGNHGYHGCSLGEGCDLTTHQCVTQTINCLPNKEDQCISYNQVKTCIATGNIKEPYRWETNKCLTGQICQNDHDGNGRCLYECSKDYCSDAGDRVISCDPYSGIKEVLCDYGTFCSDYYGVAKCQRCYHGQSYCSAIKDRIILCDDSSITEILCHSGTQCMMKGDSANCVKICDQEAICSPTRDRIISCGDQGGMIEVICPDGEICLEDGGTPVCGNPCAITNDFNETCIAGKGACMAIGEYHCIDGLLSCSAIATEPQEEICGNGFDDDCGNLIDEGCGCETSQSCYHGSEDTLNIGECKSGIQECFGSMGYGIECIGEVLPTNEICDGKDNDCDGVTDEGC